MNPLLAEHHDDLVELCRHYGVQRLEVFGSAAGDGFDQGRSDLDFLVTFDRREDIGASDQYFGLLEDLQQLFGRPVDLISPNAMRNPYFIREVNQTRRVIYDAA